MRAAQNAVRHFHLSLDDGGALGLERQSEANRAGEPRRQIRRDDNGYAAHAQVNRANRQRRAMGQQQLSAGAQRFAFMLTSFVLHRTWRGFGSHARFLGWAAA